MDTFIVGKGYTRQKPIVRKHWQTHLGTALANVEPMQLTNQAKGQMHREQLMTKIQLDPKQIVEMWIEPNMCFRIEGKTQDGQRFTYRASKGKVYLELHPWPVKVTA